MPLPDTYFLPERACRAESAYIRAHVRPLGDLEELRKFAAWKDAHFRGARIEGI